MGILRNQLLARLGKGGRDASTCHQGAGIFCATKVCCMHQEELRWHFLRNEDVLYAPGGAALAFFCTRLRWFSN
jgi:hypothetical protein